MKGGGYGRGERHVPTDARCLRKRRHARRRAAVRSRDLFKVFSDTTRIKILYALMSNELSVNDLAEAIGTSQSAVSHQLRILKQSHLVKFRRDGRNIHYSLADDHVLTILDQGLTHICE